MQIEQILTRYFKDGAIQTINKDVWDSWTSGNPEQKVANGLTTVEVPQDLLDKPIKFDTQIMQWVDASEDELNRVKSEVKKLSNELDKTKQELSKAQEDSTKTQQERDALKTKVDGMDETIGQLTFQLMQGGQQNA